MNIAELSPIQLRQAATLKEQMEKLQKKLAGLLGAASPALNAPAAPKKRKLSPAAKARLSAKLKNIWAKRKAAKVSKVVIAPKPAGKAAPATAPAPKKKWKLSAAGLARIKAANKAYWAAKKAAKRK